MTVVNTNPRPSAIFIGFTKDDLLTAGVLKHFPTCTFLENSDDLSTIRQGEYDVVFAASTDDLSGIESSLFIVSLGGDNLGYTIDNKQVKHDLFVTKNNSVATEYVSGDNISDKKLFDLVTKTLIPKYKDEKQHDTIHSLKKVSSLYRPYSDEWASLVGDKDGKIFSGAAIRDQKTGSEHWHLHYAVSDEELNQWLDYLIPHWASINPESFRKDSDWAKNPEWQLQDEIKLVKEIGLSDIEFEKQRKDYEKKHAELEAKLLKTNAVIDNSVRRLLNDQGDNLKDEVLSTLSYLGFKMTDVDKEKEAKENKSDKLEDLRAESDNEDTRWLALIEVRGYSKGAKTSDLQRISRFALRYLKDTGAEANAYWYIVNHDFKKNPGTRQQALIESKDDVDNFADDNGLVIDTVELFKLRKAVDEGILKPEDARTMLIVSTGYFTYRQPKKTQA
jgi:hypothetical protein